jgi:hypothetical protein
MLDRQLLGDVALAVLIAVPSATISRPTSVPRHAAAFDANSAPAIALASTADRQMGVFR